MIKDELRFPQWLWEAEKKVRALSIYLYTYFLIFFILLRLLVEIAWRKEQRKVTPAKGKASKHLLFPLLTWEGADSFHWPQAWRCNTLTTSKLLRSHCPLQERAVPYGSILHPGCILSEVAFFPWGKQNSCPSFVFSSPTLSPSHTPQLSCVSYHHRLLPPNQSSRAAGPQNPSWMCQI